MERRKKEANVKSGQRSQLLLFMYPLISPSNQRDQWATNLLSRQFLDRLNGILKRPCGE